MNAVQCALDFVAAINRVDIDGIYALMTEGHCFIDSDGAQVVGRETMRRAWIGFLAMVPDYAIHIQESYCHGPTVVLVGMATGTCSVAGAARPDGGWKVPAAWRAVVEDDRIAAWQVFVNPEPILRAMGKREGKTA